jgi:hypothetical protein
MHRYFAFRLAELLPDCRYHSFLQVREYGFPVDVLVVCYVVDYSRYFLTHFRFLTWAAVTLAAFAKKKVETSTVSTSKQTEVVACPYITSTASSNSKPHSFPEAETLFPRPPFAQKRSHTGYLVPCAALFTRSCQNHFLTPLPAYGGLIWLW